VSTRAATSSSHESRPSSGSTGDRVDGLSNGKRVNQEAGSDLASDFGGQKSSKSGLSSSSGSSSRPGSGKILPSSSGKGKRDSKQMLDPMVVSS
jgi:hypothetical protein